MKEFTDQVKRFWEFKLAIAEEESVLKEKKGKLENMKRDLLKGLEAAELQNYKVPGFCTINKVKEFSVSTPKELEEKIALYEYIQAKKGQDVLENMRSINSRTLNSFYKEEFDVAVEEGNYDWNLPGVKKPELKFRLGARKA